MRMVTRSGLAGLAVGLGCLSHPATGEASMNTQILPGEILDPRILSCGVEVVSGPQASFRPFIETDAGLDGHYAVLIAKRSASGRSVTRQDHAFQRGDLGASRVVLDIPAVIDIQVRVTDRDGQPLCRVDQTITLEPAPSRT